MMESKEWLCRNCNSLVDGTLNTCPHCRSDRPEEGVSEPAPEGTGSDIVVENYTNAQPTPRAKYIFREAVLVNAADIVLVLALFCAFAALLSPMFLGDVENITLISIVVAIALFAFAMVQWAVLRTLAEISRQLRNRQ